MYTRRQEQQIYLYHCKSLSCQNRPCWTSCKSLFCQNRPCSLSCKNRPCWTSSATSGLIWKCQCTPTVSIVLQCVVMVANWKTKYL